MGLQNCARFFFINVQDLDIKYVYKEKHREICVQILLNVKPKTPKVIIDWGKSGEKPQL